METTIELMKACRRLLPKLAPCLLLGCLLPIHARAEGVVDLCAEEQVLAALKGGGQVDFSCSGTVVLTEPLLITQNTVLDAGTNEVVFTTQSTNRLMRVAPGVELVLRGLVLRGGRIVGTRGLDGGPGEDGTGGESAQGGAIWNDQGRLVAVDTRFESNWAQGGAGGLGADGDAVRTRGRAGGAGGSAYGGAVDNRGDAEFVRCVFTDNAVFGGVGGNGGGAYTNEVLALGGDGGRGGAAYGAAIYNGSNALLTLQNCSFVQGVAGGEIGGGGGLGASGRSFPAQSGAAGRGSGGAIHHAGNVLIAERVTFQANTAIGAGGWSGLNGLEARSGQDGFPGGEALGGAVTVSAGTATFTNCTWFQNSASGGTGGDGGAGGSLDLGAGGGDGGNGGRAAGAGFLAMSTGQAHLLNCTLSLNKAQGGQAGQGGAAGTALQDRGDAGRTGSALGGGVANLNGTVALLNTILDNNNAGNNGSGIISDGGHNLSSDATPVWSSDSSRSTTDPRVAWLADNGGFTLTAALKADSPAIDAGNDVTAPAVDQRGQPRQGTADIGAFEFVSATAEATLQPLREGNDLMVQWPATLTGWRLEMTTDPANAPWTEITDIVNEGGLNRFRIAPTTTDAALYFRLAR
ncbi:MAG: choice-of-anchor Q domain-containing protein [Limisphaerales bacterium]